MLKALFDAEPNYLNSPSSSIIIMFVSHARSHLVVEHWYSYYGYQLLYCSIIYTEKDTNAQ